MQLKFDSHLSDWIQIKNGIGQGDLLSMILYIIYDSDLVDIVAGHHKKEWTLAFVDDTAFIAIGSSFREMHTILKHMLERPGGGYNWARDHNSKFETSKFALVDILMNAAKEHPPLITHNTTITPSATHKFLGVTGIPLSLMCQLYLTVALPKMLYAVDLWLCPLFVGT